MTKLTMAERIRRAIELDSTILVLQYGYELATDQLDHTHNRYLKLEIDFAKAKRELTAAKAAESKAWKTLVAAVRSVESRKNS